MAQSASVRHNGTIVDDKIPLLKTAIAQSASVRHNGTIIDDKILLLARQIFPHFMVHSAAVKAMSSDEEEDRGEELRDLIKQAQERDPLSCQWLEAAQNIASKGKDTHWSILNGLLCYEGRTYIPNEATIRSILLEMFHDEPWDGGHFGADKTTEKLRSAYHWENMAADVKKYVQTCDVCQRVKAKLHRPYGELTSLPQPRAPYTEISMDFITGLPPSEWMGKWYNAILVIMDRYSKHATYIRTTKNITSSELVDVFIHEVVRRHGWPEGIVSDRGSVFTSEFWEAVCRGMKVKRRLSTAFHPQTDGQTERQNRTLRQYLVCYCHDEQSNWASMLDSAEFAYNSSKYSLIKRSPFKRLMGYRPRIAWAVIDNSMRGEIDAEKCLQ